MSAASRKSPIKDPGEPKAQPPSAASPADEAPRDQEEYADRHLECLRTIQQAQSTLQTYHVDALTDCLKQVREIVQDVQQRSVEAYRTYADSLRAALGDNEQRDRCVQAYQAYVESLGQLATAQGEAQQEAAKAYEEYARAASGGSTDARAIQELGEKCAAARQRTLAGIESHPELRQRAVEAQAALQKSLQEAQSQSRKAIEEAQRHFLQDVQTGYEETGAVAKHQAALETYRERIARVEKRAQEIALEAQLKSIETVRQAWQSIAEAART